MFPMEWVVRLKYTDTRQGFWMSWKKSYQLEINILGCPDARNLRYNLDRLVRLGVKRVAVASSITNAADPGEESRRICSLLSATKGN